jgi:plasmid stability protein
MSKMIQIRNVPDALHRKLKSRAASEGISLSSYILRLAKRESERVSLDEMLDRLAAQPLSDPKVPPAEAIRREREAR